MTRPRRRGGASCPCPRCRGPTRVVDTRRVEKTVVRQRRCARASCRRTFATVEARR